MILVQLPVRQRQCIPPPPKVLDTLSMLIPYGEWEEILAGSSYIGVNRDYPSREWHTTNDNSLSISVNRF